MDSPVRGPIAKRNEQRRNRKAVGFPTIYFGTTCQWERICLPMLSILLLRLWHILQAGSSTVMWWWPTAFRVANMLERIHMLNVNPFGRFINGQIHALECNE